MFSPLHDRALISIKTKQIIADKLHNNSLLRKKNGVGFYREIEKPSPLRK